MTREAEPVNHVPSPGGAFEPHFSAVVEGSDDAIIATRIDGTVTSWNRGAEQIYGYRAEEMIGRRIDVVYPEAERHVFEQIYHQIIRGQRPLPVEGIRRRKDGSTVEVEVRVSPIYDDGVVIGAMAISRDVSVRRQRERDRNESREFLQRTQKLSGVGSWRSSFDETAVVYWTPEMYRIFGVTEDREVTTADFFGAVHPDDRQVVGEVATRILTTGVPEELEFRVIRADGAIRWVYTATDVRLDASSTPIGLTGVCQDVTERNENAARLAHDALHDPLTGLPNRALLLDRLEQAITHAKDRASRVAVLFTDLDRFKQINDSRGHEYGDAILQAVSRRLRSASHLAETVGRLSGDEIVLVCEDIRDGIEASERAAQVLAVFRDPFTIGGIQTHITASIGVAVSEPHSTAETLIRDADLAMYRAKERGRDCFELFDLDLRARAEQRADLEAGLWRALEHDELFLQYQPIASLDGNRFIGVEALVRWRHAERGVVEPDQFIPVAEETGLIIPIGTWVMEHALAQLNSWHHGAPGGRRWRMSVNISTVQLRAPNFLETLERIVIETGVDPSDVQLELTESILLDAAFARELLPRIRRLGIRLSIDDFGTGYSSLAYLKDLAIDELKIDRSFVDGLLGEDSSLAIVSAIVSIGRSLGLQVTAEGVENAQQLALLRELRCQGAQGFYFSRPLDPDVCLNALQRPPSSDRVEST